MMRQTYKRDGARVHVQRGQLTARQACTCLLGGMHALLCTFAPPRVEHASGSFLLPLFDCCKLAAMSCMAVLHGTGAKECVCGPAPMGLGTPDTSNRSHATPAFVCTYGKEEGC